MKKVKVKKERTSRNADSDDDNDEDCSAPKCSRPIGEFGHGEKERPVGRTCY